MSESKNGNKGLDSSSRKLLDVVGQLRNLAQTLEAASSADGFPEDEVRRIAAELDDVFSTLGDLFVNLRYADLFSSVQHSWRRISKQLTPIRDAGREFLTMFRGVISDSASSDGAREKECSAGERSLSDERAGEIAGVYRKLMDDGIADADALEAANQWGAAFFEPYLKFIKATGGDSTSAFRLAASYLKRGK